MNFNEINSVNRKNNKTGERVRLTKTGNIWYYSMKSKPIQKVSLKAILDNITCGAWYITNLPVLKKEVE